MSVECPQPLIDVDSPMWGLADSFLPDHERPSTPSRPGTSPCCDSPCDQVDGNVLCTKCFTLLDRQFDYGAEWRFYGGEDQKASNPTRCCPPSSALLSQNLGSVISSVQRRRPSQWQNRTASSAAASDASAMAGKAIQKYQSWSSMPYKDRVLCGIFDGLALNAAQHGFSPCLLEEAKALYKRFADGRITRGENREAAIAASVYISCLNNGVTRSCKEISTMFGVRSVALTKACKAFREVVRDTEAVTGTSTTTSAEDFVGRFSSRLGLDAVYVQEVREVLRRADEMSLGCDSMPPSIAAGAIALVAENRKLQLTKEQIGAACVVAPTTVQKLQRRLAGAL